MENTRKRAERVWQLINEQNPSNETSVHLLEREFIKAIDEEREGCIKYVQSTYWGFDNVAFKAWIRLWLVSFATLIWTPRKFFIAYFKSVQKVLAKGLANRKYG